MPPNTQGLATVFAFPAAPREGTLVAYGPDYVHMRNSVAPYGSLYSPRKLVVRSTRHQGPFSILVVAAPAAARDAKLSPAPMAGLFAR